jgi:hypothetical protein
MPHEFVGGLLIIVAIIAAAAIAALAVLLCAISADADRCFEQPFDPDSDFPRKSPAPAMWAGDGERPADDHVVSPADSLPSDPLRVVTWHPFGTLSGGNAKQRRIERRTRLRLVKAAARKDGDGLDAHAMGERGDVLPKGVPSLH